MFQFLKLYATPVKDQKYPSINSYGMVWEDWYATVSDKIVFEIGMAIIDIVDI